VGRSAFFSGTIFTQLFVDKGGFPILGRNGEPHRRETLTRRLWVVPFHLHSYRGGGTERPFAAREPELAGGREG